MPSPSDQVDAIERDRKRREALLLLALLALAADARRFIIAGIRDGHGIPDLSMRKLAPIILDSMAVSHVAGLRRAGALAGVELIPRGVATEELPEYEAAAGLYVPAARAKAAEVRAALAGLAVEAVTEAVRAGTSPTRSVQEAWTVNGWTARKPASVDPTKGDAKPGYAAAFHATNAVLKSYSDGTWGGMNSPEIAARLKGFRHVSILDNRTSRICEQRGRPSLQLPKEHWYWAQGVPPLHPHCRSLLLPVMTDGPWSETLPTEPVVPGWGVPSVPLFGYRFGEAA
jgi:hypothetical protein